MLNRSKGCWRQVLNETDRIETKYLFTLQQGISKNQLREMKHEHLKLVVPTLYLNSFDREFQAEIESLYFNCLAKLDSQNSKTKNN